LLELLLERGRRLLELLHLIRELALILRHRLGFLGGVVAHRPCLLPARSRSKAHPAMCRDSTVARRVGRALLERTLGRGRERT
jgi:hypothetical protein